MFSGLYGSETPLCSTESKATHFRSRYLAEEECPSRSLDHEQVNLQNIEMVQIFEDQKDLRSVELHVLFVELARVSQIGKQVSA